MNRNCLKAHIQQNTLPGNSRDTGMVAVYAVGCLAVVIVMVVGICWG